MHSVAEGTSSQVWLNLWKSTRHIGRSAAFVSCPCHILTAAKLLPFEMQNRTLASEVVLPPPLVKQVARNKVDSTRTFGAHYHYRCHLIPCEKSASGMSESN